MFFDFRKSTSGNIFFTFGSRFLKIFFDFRKSIFDDSFWFPKIDFWWYILIFGSRHNFAGVVSVSFLRWLKSFFENLKKIWRCRRNFGGAERKGRVRLGVKAHNNVCWVYSNTSPSFANPKPYLCNYVIRNLLSSL